MKVIIDKLKETFEYALKSERSQLYKDFYRDTYNSIDTISEWESLPFITREFLQPYPFHKRIFIPYETISVIRITSGTSGKGVFAVPRNAPQKYKELFVPYSLLTFERPLHTVTETLLGLTDRVKPVICGDTQNIEQSVSMASTVGVEALEYPASLMPALRPFISKYNLSEKIKVVIPTGERISPEQLAMTRELFPNAEVKILYGASELHGIAGIWPGQNYSPDIFSPQETHYFEVIDDNGEVMREEGKTGELIITTLLTPTLAMPLLRYKIGDMAKIVKWHEDPHQRLYQILGRKELDKVKVVGGEIQVAVLESVLSKISPKLAERFECHIDTSSKYLNLTIKFEESVFRNETSMSTDDISNAIAERLLVSPRYTYSEGIKNDLYKKIKIELVPGFSQGTLKFRKLWHKN